MINRLHLTLQLKSVLEPLTSNCLLSVSFIPSQNIQHRKYARWKATYIHNCLKSGETPQSGPIGMDEDGEAGGPSDMLFFLLTEQTARSLKKASFLCWHAVICVCLHLGSVLLALSGPGMFRKELKV